MELLADRYELAEVLGAGGMARVVAAYDHRLHRRVAVKLVREELTADPVSRERLLREARAAASLQHPNTVAVHDVGEQDGQAYVVMELVDGGTLADRLRELGRLPAGEVVALAAALLAALQAAHERGLVHRDVKPANVLLPAGGGIKLADFGIAKALDAAAADLTATGQVLGTPRYLAPEQTAGEPATPASDLYSLGTVLFECLAGRPPFDAESTVALALAHRHEPVPDLTSLAPDVPPALAEVVERALSKDPAGRGGSAAAMRAALLATVAGGPGTAASGPGTAGVGIGTAPLDTAPARASGTTTVLGAFGGTTTLPADAPEDLDEAAGRRQRWLPVAVGLAAIAFAGLIAVLLTGDDAGDPAPADGASGDPADGADTDRPPAAGDDPAGDDPADDPADLDDLAARLARDPGGAGERGDELLVELVDLRETRGQERAEDAREIITEVAGWVAAGELDEDVGRQAVRLLEPEGRPDGEAWAPVSELFAEVAVDKRAWGEKADSLLSGLEDLLDKGGRERTDAADKLAREIESWVDKGELEPSRGQEAVRVLRAVPGA